MSFTKELEHLRIPFGDIEVATNNFGTIIGRGGYGPVYKGELRISGNLTSVAVKRLLQNIDASGQGLKEFLTEINLLSRYKHPNLVSLIGFCEEGREKILIYEYAEHGSFDKYLINKANRLTWRQRLHICVDAARGLDYLHNRVGADHRIIHRDIKSGNILLDGNFRAKIADLGLSKIGRVNVIDTFLITNVSGTPSYVDPVYVDTGVLSKKSDVYSFGVVLFEALCARLCFMDVIGEQRNLVRLAQRCYKQGKLNVIVDPELKDVQSVKVFSSIAYQCLHDKQEARPSMDVVLQKLEKALELLETYELQEFLEALVLQEVLEVLEAMELEVAQDLHEICELQQYVEALVLQEVLKYMEAMELRVRWDETSSIPRPDRVSPWKIEPALTPPAINPLPIHKQKRPRSTMLPSSPDSSVLTREASLKIPTADPSRVELSNVRAPFVEINDSDSCDNLSVSRLPYGRPAESSFTDLLSGFGSHNNSTEFSNPWTKMPSNLPLNLLGSSMKGVDVPFQSYSIHRSPKWMMPPPLPSYLHIPSHSNDGIPKSPLVQSEVRKPQDGSCKIFGVPLAGNTVASPGKDREKQYQNSQPQVKVQGAVSTRSCTKVHKQGIALVRSLDLTKFNNYDELIAELDDLFEFNGELKTRNKTWLVVYTDDEGDMMLVGDDPWQEFCAMVRKIFIYTREEIQRINLETLNSRGDDTSSVAEGMDTRDTRTTVPPSSSSPDHA